MPEAAVKAYGKEAERLFQRGVAAARGGQRRVAAGLLIRAVQLDPRHEAAWLWLSGVLDDPHDVAFCLRAALRINPNNQRALSALRWLEERKLQTPPATEVSVVRSIDLDPPPSTDPEPTISWWVQFRESLKAEAMMRALKTFGVVALYAVVVITVIAYRQVQARPPAALPAPVAEPQVEQSPSPPQQPLTESPELARARILSYLSEVQLIRDDLREAQQEYRSASEGSGIALAQATAARTYRERLVEAAARLAEIRPPAALQEAHAAYLTGLEFEQSALDDLLQFYSEYNVALANRAALRLQEANVHLSQARAVWDAYGSEIAAQSSPPPFSAR